MMLRNFEEKQAANNEKENEEKDVKVCCFIFYIIFNCYVTLLYHFPV